MKVKMPKGESIFFLVRPDQTVLDFARDMTSEDSSIKNVSFHIGDSKFANGTNLLNVIESGSIDMIVDGKKYKVEKGISAQNQVFKSPVFDHPSPTAQLSTAVVAAPIGHISDLPIEFQREVRLLHDEILPLYRHKKEMDSRATKYVNLQMWGGLAYLVAQWSVMARLTWWEFNWDIMEPVTYFVSFGTAVLGYAYFAFIKRDYTFVDLRDALLHRRMLKIYLKEAFDIDRYFALEHRLKRLDPDFEFHLDEILAAQSLEARKA